MDRFAGQQRFVDRQVRRFDQMEVGRYPIAFGEQDSIADDQFAASDPDSLPISHPQRTWTGQVSQRLQ